jgi:hypothetical protein
MNDPIFVASLKVAKVGKAGIFMVPYQQLFRLQTLPMERKQP